MSFSTSNDQLAALITALERGEEISEDVRHKLVEALYDLSLYHAIEEKSRKRGTPIAADTWLAARIAQRLVEDYGVAPKEAVYAARPDGDHKEHSRITRAYHRLKKGNAPIAFGPVHPDLVDQAADNINPARLERAIAMKAKQK